MKTLLLAPLFLTVASAGDSLAIHYYNRAGVPTHVLDSAVQEAARVLARAGVETVWTECAPEDPEGRTFDFSGRSAYQLLNPDVRSYLVVTIGRRGQASGPRETLGGGKLGFALPDAENGVHAFIFFDRVEEATRPKLIATDKVLGNAIAHEIGHVLLGSGQHSNEGIMKARWDRSDYMRAETGRLRFTAAEGEIIRAHAAARITASNRASHAQYCQSIRMIGSPDTAPETDSPENWIEIHAIGRCREKGTQACRVGHRIGQQPKPAAESPKTSIVAIQ